jgi:hypothetical protein
VLEIREQRKLIKVAGFWIYDRRSLHCRGRSFVRTAEIYQYMTLHCKARYRETDFPCVLCLSLSVSGYYLKICSGYVLPYSSHFIICILLGTQNLNWSLVKPRESTFLGNSAIATMAVTRGKCIVSHKNHVSPSLYCACVAFSVVFFPTKPHEVCTHGRPYLLSVSHQNDMSPGRMLLYY